MGGPTKEFLAFRKKRIDSIIYTNEKQKHEKNKAASKEAAKTDPSAIRRRIAMGVPKGIDADKKEAYELLYNKLDARAQELFNLIMHDLGLDKDSKTTLSPCDIIDVIDYYQDKGINQLKVATNEYIMQYNAQKLTPYEKLFKNLIAKRAEFLIVAPKERLTLYAPYQKIQENSFKISLVKHLADLKIIQNSEFSEKHPDLKEIYDNIKEKDYNL